MREFDLHFSHFIYDDDIFEIIVHEDIEITELMVRELFELIESIDPKPSLILVNRKNIYSYTFKANIMLATTRIADRIAVLKYGRLPWPLKGILTPRFYRLAFFDERETAINWLKSNKEKL